MLMKRRVPDSLQQRQSDSEGLGAEGDRGFVCLCAAASVRAHLICLRLHFWGLPEAAHGGLHVGRQLSMTPKSCLQKLPMQPVRDMKLRALTSYLLAHLYKHTEILLDLLMHIALLRMSGCKCHGCTQLAAVSAMEQLQ